MKTKRESAVSFLAIKIKYNGFSPCADYHSYTTAVFKVSPVSSVLTCSCLEVLYLVINGVKWLVKCFSLLEGIDLIRLDYQSQLLCCFKGKELHACCYFIYTVTTLFFAQ